MLPAAAASNPAVSEQVRVSAVVVLLPFVPVIAITGASQLAERELEFRDARHPGDAGRQDRRRRRDAGAQHDQVARASSSAACGRPSPRTTQRAELRGGSRSRLVRCRVGREHVVAARPCEPRGRPAAACESEDADAHAQRIFSVLKAIRANSSPGSRSAR
jgi:hypothetical protein